MTTIEELREKAKADIEAARVRIANKIEVITLTAQIERANNPVLCEAIAAADISEMTSNKLKTIEMACEQIITAMPETNRRTRENYKWNPRREYGLGLHVQALTGLLNGVQYSSQKHKPQLLAVLGLSED